MASVDPSLNAHEREYRRARALGWPGWGGPERIARNEATADRMWSNGPVPPNGRALELGCGEGWLSRRLARRGHDVTGVDFAPTAIAWARERAMADGLDVRFLEADVSAVDTDLGGPYALIVDGNCLHCIVGDARRHALANVRRALAADGVLYVSSICSRDVDRVFVGSNRLERWAGTLASLERELAHAGLRTIGSQEWWRDGPTNHATLYAVRDDASA